MRFAFTWLMVLGVLCGLHSRVIGNDPCDLLAEMHRAEKHATPASPHLHEDNAPCDSSHDSNCPVEHHNSNGACSHALPLTTENDFVRRLTEPTSDLVRMISESELVPEGPYLSSVKPPLI
ncbi:MAG: hypothetical protein H8M99_05850 [Gloeobacteraceae cyanobacterium ES-bin-144]|nr:hypothetical protein [Verrucomicrobiales bacterium]